ncbi:MAG: PQQ-binding-like beta-propeller repeat protein [Pseudomonadota bacterium]
MAVSTAKGVFLVAALGIGLWGCGEDERLKGKRFDVRTPLEETETIPPEELAAAANTVDVRDPAERVSVARSVPISLSGMVNHQSWTHRGGSSTHRVTHPALAPNLSLQWSANIGAGNNRRGQLASDPIVANGRVFTIDSASRVTAVSTGGGTLWTTDLTPASDRTRDASGGGMSYGNGRLFATTGFGELVALDPSNGAIAWRQDFDAPVTGAPTVAGVLVYVIARDSAAFAVRADNGRLAWQLPGTPSPSGLISGAGPAVTDRLALFPTTSSEVTAALRQGGIRVWGASIAGERRGQAYAGVIDIAGDPVVMGNKVFVGSQSGRFAAVSASSGERLWTAREGAYSPGWPVGDSVFIVSDQAQLIRLNAETGETIWAVDLPYFRKERLKRRKGVYSHHGPVLAGGRLLVGSDDGQLRSFDPRDGSLLSSVSVPGGAASLPAIVNGTLYILSGNGQLLAYR